MNNASAFVRLSPSGRSFASGHVDIWIDDREYVGPGLRPQWADEDTLYYLRPDGALMRWRRWIGSDVVMPQVAFNEFSAGGPDRWAGYLAGIGVIFSNGLTVEPWSSPALSENPEVWAVTLHQTQTLIVNNWTQTHPLARASCRDLRWAFRTLAWNVFVDGAWKISGMRSIGGEPELLNVESEEFWPVPFYVGSELWILSHSHTRVMIRPWGSKTGYVIVEGIANTPDVKWTGTHVRVVWDALNNTLGEFLQDITLPRVDLRTAVDPPPPEEEDVNAPGITITHWDPTLSETGEYTYEWKDRNNPGHKFLVRFKDGRFRVEMTYDDWQAKTDRSSETSRHVNIKD